MKIELKKRARECTSVEELLALAKENDIDMTPEDAEAKLALLHNECELSDDELDAASGGGCGKEEAHFEEKKANCSKCGRMINLSLLYTYSEENGVYICEHCEDGQIAGDISAAYNRVAERHR